MLTKLKNLPQGRLKINSNSRLFKIYQNLENESLKCANYFQVYEDLLSGYVGKKITFVEVGVLHGGSLFMWREYFGDQARIIGVDLNPNAKQLEKHGFEIFIGSQSSNVFWENFYSKIGKVDILIDDGGHDNDQQIITLNKTIPNIKDGGILLVEDTHASYLKKHGNPSKYSFINYSKHLIDVMNSRFPGTNIKTKNKFKNKIYSIAFYESVVALKIDEEKSLDNISLYNQTKNLKDMYDMYKTNYFPRISKLINEKYSFLNKTPILRKIIRKIFFTNNFLVRFKNYLKLKKYFN
jgi:hypothetical protein